MAEFIINGEQFEKAMAAIDYELRQWSIDRPVNEVFVSGDELPVLVRCRDCKSWAGPCCDDDDRGTCDGWSLASGTVLMVTNADDFCSYGKRATE